MTTDSDNYGMTVLPNFLNVPEIGLLKFRLRQMASKLEGAILLEYRSDPNEPAIQLTIAHGVGGGQLGKYVTALRKAADCIEREAAAWSERDAGDLQF